MSSSLRRICALIVRETERRHCGSGKEKFNQILDFSDDKKSKLSEGEEKLIKNIILRELYGLFPGYLLLSLFIAHIMCILVFALLTFFFSFLNTENRICILPVK